MFVIFFTDKLCAIGSLMHLIKAQTSEAGNQLIGGDVLEKGGVGTSQDGNFSVLSGKDLGCLFATVGDNFSVLCTYGDAFPAPNAARVDNFDVGGADPNGFDRAIAHTCITLAAAFFYGFYRSHGIATPEWKGASCLKLMVCSRRAMSGRKCATGDT
jgi:hypothetical protein